MSSELFRLPLSPEESGQQPAQANFLADEQSCLVAAVLDALLSEPAQAQPVLLWGGTGTGKTLLADTICGHFQHYRGDAEILRITGADFARAVATALETEGLADLRERLAQVRLLVLDHVDQLVGKTAAQRELAFLLDELADGGGAAVVIAPRAPSDLPKLSAYLSSRLQRGLAVELRPPGESGRGEWIEQFAREQGIKLTPDAIELLAARVDGPLGKARALLLSLAAEPESADKTLDVDAVQPRLAALEARERPTLPEIARAVARHFRVKASEMRSPTRRRSVVQARSVAMHLARSLAGSSLSEIGRFFGDRDHSTVLHACRKTSEQAVADPTLGRALDALAEQLRPE